MTRQRTIFRGPRRRIGFLQALEAFSGLFELIMRLCSLLLSNCGFGGKTDRISLYYPLVRRIEMLHAWRIDDQRRCFKSWRPRPWLNGQNRR